MVPLCAIMALLACTQPGFAAGCVFPPLDEGRVASVVDAMSFRLTDGNEVRLAGIEPVTGITKADRAGALAAIIEGHDVTLRGQHDAPDRYGWQIAFVYLTPSQSSVQELLLAQGEAFASPDVADKDCAAALMAAEKEARQAKKGIWADPSVIKNAESPDDILTMIGR
ncbi:MAG: thermonuclease family protein, partial [Bradyrhizobium sp.]